MASSRGKLFLSFHIVCYHVVDVCFIKQWLIKLSCTYGYSFQQLLHILNMVLFPNGFSYVFLRMLVFNMFFVYTPSVQCVLAVLPGALHAGGPGHLGDHNMYIYIYICTYISLSLYKYIYIYIYI